MANICNNEFYAYSDNPENIKYIQDWFVNEYTNYIEIETTSDTTVDGWFESRWTFPEEQMNQLYEGLPDKEDIYMRCLSVEYGNDYVDYHKCEEDGWYQVI